MARDPRDETPDGERPRDTPAPPSKPAGHQGKAVEDGSGEAGTGKVAAGMAGKDKSGKDKSGKDGAARRTQPTEAEMRARRAAQKLRENLARRKVQVRARRKGEAETGIGLPASHTESGEDD